MGDVGGLGVAEQACGDGRIDPHRRLALGHVRLALREAAARGAGLAVAADQVDVEADGGLGGRGGQLRPPLHVEPRAAERVDDRRERRAHLAPARQAAQADAVPVLRWPVQRPGIGGDLVPGGMQGHRQVRLAEQPLVVEGHRALAVERQGVHVALVREALFHLGEQVAEVVGFGSRRAHLGHVGLQVDEPAILGPDRHLVGAHGGQVKLPATGGHIRGDLLAQRVLRQGDVFDPDAVLLLKGRGEVLHVHHVRVVHGGDGERGGCVRRCLRPCGLSRCRDRDKCGEEWASDDQSVSMLHEMYSLFRVWFG